MSRNRRSWATARPHRHFLERPCSPLQLRKTLLFHPPFTGTVRSSDPNNDSNNNNNSNKQHETISPKNAVPLPPVNFVVCTKNTHLHTRTRTHTHTRTHSRTHELTNSRTHELTNSLTHSQTHSIPHSLTHIHELTNSRTHALNELANSRKHARTHSPASRSPVEVRSPLAPRTPHTYTLSLSSELWNSTHTGRPAGQPADVKDLGIRCSFSDTVPDSCSFLVAVIIQQLFLVYFIDKFILVILLKQNYNQFLNHTKFLTKSTVTAFTLPATHSLSLSRSPSLTTHSHQEGPC